MTGTISARLISRLPERSARRSLAQRFLSPVNVVIAFATLTAFCLRAAPLANGHLLFNVTEYDDGVYFGSAVRFVHGILPYRNFVMVQPPGIVLLMTPAALLSKAAGTAWGMAAGRIMTVLASTASVTLTGFLVRHRGITATAVATGIMTVYLSNLVDARSVLVEPWLALFCLIAAVAVFDRDRLTISMRRLAWAGVAAGFAGAIEVWAIFPVLVILALILLTSVPPCRLRSAWTFAAGVMAGFCVPVLPFVAVAARSMFQDIIASQINRVLPARTGLWFRLQWMTSTFSEVRLGHVAIAALALVPVVVIGVGTALGWLLARSAPPALDWFSVATTVLVVGAFLWNEQFFLHFPAFLAPFLSVALALPVGRIVGAFRERAGDRQLASPRAITARTWLPASLAAAAVMAIAAAQLGEVTNIRPVVSQSAIAAAQRLVPAGACVFTDQASYLVAANRFVSAKPSCSQMVDPLATGYALGHGREGVTGAGQVRAVAAALRDALAHADYAWLTVGYDARRIAWSPALRTYFNDNFTPIYADGHRDVIYMRSKVKTALGRARSRPLSLVR